MEPFADRLLLRVYIDETDLIKGKPLYEQIVLYAKDLGLSGATVLRGIMGYGSHSMIHSAKVLRLSEDLPVVVEIIDSKENLDKIMPYLQKNVCEGLITLEKIQVIRCKQD